MGLFTWCSFFLSFNPGSISLRFKSHFCSSVFQPQCFSPRWRSRARSASLSRPRGRRSGTRWCVTMTQRQRQRQRQFVWQRHCYAIHHFTMIQQFKFYFQVKRIEEEIEQNIWSSKLLNKSRWRLIQDKFHQKGVFQITTNWPNAVVLVLILIHFRYFLWYDLTISLKCNIINTGIAFQRFSGKKCVSTLPRGRFSLMSL